MTFAARAVKVPPNSANRQEAKERVFDFFKMACHSIPTIMDIYILDDVVTVSQLRTTIASKIRKYSHVTDPKVAGEPGFTLGLPRWEQSTTIFRYWQKGQDLLTKDYNYEHKFTLSMLTSSGMVLFSEFSAACCCLLYSWLPALVTHLGDLCHSSFAAVSDLRYAYIISYRITLFAEWDFHAYYNTRNKCIY